MPNAFFKASAKLYKKSKTKNIIMEVFFLLIETNTLAEETLIQ